MDKQDLMNELRRFAGECEQVSNTTGLLLRRVDDLGYTYQSRVGYFINLGSVLTEMAAEALCTACNLIAENPPVEDGTVLREWRFEDVDESHLAPR